MCLSLYLYSVSSKYRIIAIVYMLHTKVKFLILLSQLLHMEESSFLALCVTLVELV